VADWVVMAAVVRFQDGVRLRKGRQCGGGTDSGRGKEEEAE
jgi:hypothetical protein